MDSPNVYIITSHGATESREADSLAEAARDAERLYGVGHVQAVREASTAESDRYWSRRARLMTQTYGPRPARLAEGIGHASDDPWSLRGVAPRA